MDVLSCIENKYSIYWVSNYVFVVLIYIYVGFFLNVFNFNIYYSFIYKYNFKYFICEI